MKQSSVLDVIISVNSVQTEAMTLLVAKALTKPTQYTRPMSKHKEWSITVKSFGEK